MIRLRRHAPGMVFVALVAFVILALVLASLLALVTFAALERTQAIGLLCLAPVRQNWRRA